jgi:hypothetical protein
MDEKSVAELEISEKIFKFTKANAKTSENKQDGNDNDGNKEENITIHLLYKDFYLIRSGSDAQDFTGVRVWVREKSHSLLLHKLLANTHSILSYNSLSVYFHTSARCIFNVRVYISQF